MDLHTCSERKRRVSVAKTVPRHVANTRPFAVTFESPCDRIWIRRHAVRQDEKETCVSPPRAEDGPVLFLDSPQAGEVGDSPVGEWDGPVARC